MDNIKVMHVTKYRCVSGLKNIVAAFRGMHVSPAKNIAIGDYLESVTTRQTDTRTAGQTDAEQSDSYVQLCFAGNTKTKCFNI